MNRTLRRDLLKVPCHGDRGRERLRKALRKMWYRNYGLMTKSGHDHADALRLADQRTREDFAAWYHSHEFVTSGVKADTAYFFPGEI